MGAKETFAVRLVAYNKGVKDAEEGKPNSPPEKYAAHAKEDYRQGYMAGLYKRKTNPKRRKRNSRAAARPSTGYHGEWVITATKKSKGARMFYAGGARLTSMLKDAIKFPSIIHADQVKGHILKDFPAKLTAAYLWQTWPMPT